MSVSVENPLEGPEFVSLGTLDLPDESDQSTRILGVVGEAFGRSRDFPVIISAKGHAAEFMTEALKGLNKQVQVAKERSDLFLIDREASRMLPVVFNQSGLLTQLAAHEELMSMAGVLSDVGNFYRNNTSDDLARAYWQSGLGRAERLQSPVSTAANPVDAALQEALRRGQAKKRSRSPS